jgi:hypothetical protein
MSIAEIFPALATVGLTGLLFYRGTPSRRAEALAATAFLSLPGVVWAPVAPLAQVAWVRALLLGALTVIVWDRRAPWARNVPPLAQRMKRLVGWALAAVAAFALSGLAGQGAEPAHLGLWAAGVLLDEGRFALWLALGVVVFVSRKAGRTLPSSVAHLLVWCLLHLALLLVSPEARHFSDSSAAFLVIALSYLLGAWALEQLIPKYSWMVWTLLLAHSARAWWVALS